MNKIFLALLAGLAVGILVAPGKGSETWKKLTDGLDDIKDKATDQLNGLVDKGKGLIGQKIEKAETNSQSW